MNPPFFNHKIKYYILIVSNINLFYNGNITRKRIILFQLTTGRDLTLEPKQDDKPLNNFGYPYAEVEGKALDYYNPADFEYNIKFEEAK